MGSGGDIPFHYGGTLSTDAVVLKTDSLGELEWVQVLGSSFETSFIWNNCRDRPTYLPL